MHDLGGLDVYYLSDIHAECLAAGDTTGCRLEMIFLTWCIFKLDYCVTLCSVCLILVVDNVISHMGIKKIFWNWGVCGVTMTSELSNHV